MIFNKIIETGICNNRKKTFHREAVRAVILKDNKLLMINTNMGDYKFPGGGIQEGENHEEALVRELMEETGYSSKKVNKKIGFVLERRPDKFDCDAIFEMESNYYTCEVSSKQVEQKLDEYEAKLDFQPVWISIEDAISRNKNLLNAPNTKTNRWVGRELYVLEALIEHFK